MVIILMVSVVVLPTLVATLGERGVVNGATLLQGALVGARDAAIASKLRRDSPAVGPDAIHVHCHRPGRRNEVPGQQPLGADQHPAGLH